MPSRRQPDRERNCSIKPWFTNPPFSPALGTHCSGAGPSLAETCLLYRGKPNGMGQGSGIAFSVGDALSCCIRVAGGDGGLSCGSEAFPKAPGAGLPFRGPRPWEKAKLQ